MNQVKDLLSDNQKIQQCKTLQELANVIHDENPTVQLVTFQSSSKNGINVVTQNDFSNTAGDLFTTGPF